MLPSRPQLEGWQPDSLSFTGPAVTSGGAAVEQALDRVNRNVKSMPDTRDWSGPAHDAAADMFDRAHEGTTDFAAYADAVGKALGAGAGAIGSARTALLDKADDVDRGELHVNDQWVVLMDPAPMTAEKVAELMKQVTVEQGAINRLLLALGAADDDTAADVSAAAHRFGYAPPNADGLGGMMIPGLKKPTDAVPNPSDSVGIFQQGVIRGEDMGNTVRDTTQGYDTDDHYVKTLTMQDGSKHVITEYKFDYDRGVPDMVTDEQWDAAGSWVSKTSSSKTPNGTATTTINWADGTQFVGTETPDGTRTAAFTLPDGRHGVLPPDNPFFTGAVPTVTGNVLTGLEAHIGRGGSLPMVSMDAVENIGKGAKFGGPALGILTTIYDMGVAETPYDRCVAGFSGGFGIVGDWAGGATGGFVGGLVPGVEEVTVPGGAVVGSYYGGEWMKSIGAKIAVPFCQ